MTEVGVSNWKHRFYFALVSSRIRAFLAMAIAARVVVVACRIANAEMFLIASLTLIAVALYPRAGLAQSTSMPASTHCRSESPFRYSSVHSNWTGWSTSATNSRFQDAAGAALRAEDVPNLKLKWRSD
jgi:hypothetical protein